MLRLQKPGNDPRRVDLGGGAALWCRPATSLLMQAAQAGLTDRLRAIRDGGEVLEDLGIDLPDVLADANATRGLAQHLLDVELGMQCIDRLEGIGDADGVPITAPDRRALSMLFLDEAIATAFRGAVLVAVHRWTDEGNASGSSRTGAGGEVPTTAPTAEPSASLAQAAAAAPTASAAPKSRTRR